MSGFEIQAPDLPESTLKALDEAMRRECDVSAHAREMPRYQCHKQVWALKIHALEQKACLIGEEWDGTLLMTPDEDGYDAFVLDADYVRKHKPQVGGYYVVYLDGYTSFSPAEAFEGGYTRI